MYIIPRNIPNNWCLDLFRWTCFGSCLCNVSQDAADTALPVKCSLPVPLASDVHCHMPFWCQDKHNFLIIESYKKNITKQGNLMNLCCINIIYLAVLINSGQHSDWPKGSIFVITALYSFNWNIIRHEQYFTSWLNVSLIVFRVLIGVQLNH